ncbi:MAG: hypothetical protein KJP00_10985 [Bacteroidia bacterium]|nr:hypothetical protein [Bacteroidia bacterium]
MGNRNKKRSIFLLGLMAIYLLVFKIVPYINQNSKNEVIRFVNENELDTGTLFYTESAMGISATQELVQKRRQ